MNARDVAEFGRLLVELRERVERLEAELREPGTAEPVGLKKAARIAGVSTDTMYRDARRYGGWKVDPSKPKSQWRFDPEMVRQARDAATPPVALEPRRRQRRPTVPLLPVKDRAA